MTTRRAPGYVELATRGQLARRVRTLQEFLHSCTVCPRRCAVDRRNELGECATGSQAVVASWTPHFGEEPAISAKRGSGTVFLANCNLRCAFCQNHEISQGKRTSSSSTTSTEELAAIFVELQNRGCHNINWVSPTHQVPQLTAALELAAHRGLAIPVVYNSNGYDSVEVLRLLDGVVDVYMPDLKYSDTVTGNELSGAQDYPLHARTAILEMFRQVGDKWILDDEGALVRGLLIRLLVLPNDLAGVEESLRWIAEELSPRVGISLMAQYYPAHRTQNQAQYPLLCRTISAGEWGRALESLEHWMDGDHHNVQDHQSSPRYYRPDFSDPEVPFADIDDFI
ncbi:MAG: radical SAM protein [bacterium]|nr:radical SAM protein [bacterium]